MSVTVFDGEQITQVEVDEEERQERPASPPKIEDQGFGFGSADTRRYGEDQKCGGGRRIIRKRISD